MAEVDDLKDLSRCVFCRVHTSELYFEKMRSELSSQADVPDPGDRET